MEFDFFFEKKKYHVSLEEKDGRYRVAMNRKEFTVDFKFFQENCISLLIENRSHMACCVEDETKLHISVDGREVVLEMPAGEKRFSKEVGIEHAKNLVFAPMPGQIVKVEVSEGAAVRKNQILAIVEAMKMENQVRAPFESTVKKILVKKGDLVDTEQPIIELAEKEAPIQ